MVKKRLIDLVAGHLARPGGLCHSHQLPKCTEAGFRELPGVGQQSLGRRNCSLRGLRMGLCGRFEQVPPDHDVPARIPVATSLPAAPST